MTPTRKIGYQEKEAVVFAAHYQVLHDNILRLLVRPERRHGS